MKPHHGDTKVSRSEHGGEGRTGVAQVKRRGGGGEGDLNESR